MGIPLLGQQHVDRYHQTDGAEGHDRQDTTVLLLTTTARNSGAYPAGCEPFWSAHERLAPQQLAELVRACYRGPQSADAIHALIDDRR